MNLATRGAAALVAVATASTLAAGIAEAAPTARVVAQTQKMTGPSLTTKQVGWYPAGARVTLQCYERGQSVKGALSKWHPNGGWDNLWYKTSDGVFVADIDIETGSNNPVTGACSGGQPATQPTPTPAPSSAKVGRAIAWANGQVGSQAYDFACQRFVENAYGTSGRYGSAIAMRNQLAAAGQIHMDRNIPAGALVFSRNSRYDRGYGHVVIATGGGQYVSGGVSKSYGSRATVQRLSSWNPAGGSEYLGWAYAPSNWPGR
ncbi:hypothetical protein ACFWXB_19280 [Tsukamurella tyrosinosolvens]|uniref:hypothetical protein n=1 Tax=Tsukamurella tyrosinosolvens TaxID=57704 RepID=UPI000DF6A28A|nr:hypothetical protein [Tsukamurella tyrosinosolvens]QRY86139.1 hypothetical protein JVY00_08850 [Tsukamurella tyrosinosolvens]RDB49378.1 hypothetical protein DVB87_03350 [Tsukamurella tyrosinosolvens]